MDIDGLQIGNERPIFLIAGPCVIESEASTLAIAAELARLSQIGRSRLRASGDTPNLLSGLSPVVATFVWLRQR